MRGRERLSFTIRWGWDGGAWAEGSKTDRSDWHSYWDGGKVWVVFGAERTASRHVGKEKLKPAPTETSLGRWGWNWVWRNEGPPHLRAGRKVLALPYFSLVGSQALLLPGPHKPQALLLWRGHAVGRARYVKTVDRDPRGVREHTVGPEMEKVATPLVS